MLRINDNLTSYTLSAGEPWLMDVQLLRSNGQALDIDDTAMTLSIYRSTTREIVQQSAGERMQDVSGDEFFRWAFPGTLSETLYGQPSLRVEIARRYKDGRSVLGDGSLTVKPSAQSVPSLGSGPIGDIAIRATIKANAVLGEAPTIAFTAVAVDVTTSTPAPPPTATPTPTPALSALIVQIGDSVPSGYVTNGVSAINQLGYPSGVAINNGYSISAHEVVGITADVPNGLASLYTSSKTCIALLQRGINDLGNSSRSASATYSAHADKVALYKAQGFYVAICTLLPRSDGSWSSTKEAERIAYNNLVRANSAGADRVIDLAADSVIGAAGASDDATLFADKLHPTATGQDRIAVVYKAALDQMVGLAVRPPATLQTLSLGTATGTAGAGYSSNVNDRTAGSTITATSSDGTSLIVNGAVLAGTFATAGMKTVTLVETIPGAVGSPKTSAATVTVAASAGRAPMALTSPTFGAVKYGNGMTGGSAVVPNDVSPALPFTVEAWGSAIGTGLQVLFGERFSYYVGVNDGGFARASTFGAGGSADYADIDSNVPVRGNGAHHFALVMTTGGARLYVDGVQAGANAKAPAASSVLLNLRRFDVADAFGTDFAWQGAADELAVFSGERYTANFTPPTSPYSGNEANLIALYHLNGDGADSKA